MNTTLKEKNERWTSPLRNYHLRNFIPRVISISAGRNSTQDQTGKLQMLLKPVELQKPKQRGK